VTKSKTDSDIVRQKVTDRPERQAAVFTVHLDPMRGPNDPGDAHLIKRLKESDFLEVIVRLRTDSDSVLVDWPEIGDLPPIGARLLSRAGMGPLFADRVHPLAAEPADNALSRARARGKAYARKIAEDEEMLTASALAKRMHVKPQEVYKALAKGELCAIRVDEDFRFPVWQLDEDGKPYPEIRELSIVLGGPLPVLRFLMTEHGELDGATGRAVLANRRDAADVLLRTAVSSLYSFS